MNFALAMDALESVKHTPTSSSLWQRLSTLTQGLQGEARTTVVKEISALPLDGRDAQWFRCSALAYLSRDPVWLARQAALVDETTAPDAIMTFLSLAWHDALVRTSESGAFVQLMKDIDAPRLQALLARRMSGQEQTRSDGPAAPLRVAIYTPQVVNSRHGGTTFTLNVMSVLAREGVDLRTFSAQEANIPAVDSYHGGVESLTPVLVEAESLALNAPGSFQLMLANAQFSLRSRFEQILQAIDAFAPDIVIFVGFMSPLVFRLYEQYPVVGLSVHALPPLSPVDVWLSADPQSRVMCWPGVPAPQVFPFPFRFWPTGQATPVDRSSVDLPAGATVLVTAGFRLNTEMTPPWSESVLAFIEAHADVHWLLIGVTEELSHAVLSRHPRIHRLPPQPRLEAWLAMCDIYLNPPRIGGGGALAMAMEQGLAVLTFANSDGGDKVGAQAISSDDEYFARLQAWVTDPVSRRQAGEALRARFHARLDFSGKEPAAGLMQACQKGIALFNQRRVASSA